MPDLQIGTNGLLRLRSGSLVTGSTGTNKCCCLPGGDGGGGGGGGTPIAVCPGGTVVTYCGTTLSGQNYITLDIAFQVPAGFVPPGLGGRSCVGGPFSARIRLEFRPSACWGAPTVVISYSGTNIVFNDGTFWTPYDFSVGRLNICCNANDAGTHFQWICSGYAKADPATSICPEGLTFVEVTGTDHHGALDGFVTPGTLSFSVDDSPP